MENIFFQLFFKKLYICTINKVCYDFKTQGDKNQS